MLYRICTGNKLTYYKISNYTFCIQIGKYKSL